MGIVRIMMQILHVIPRKHGFQNWTGPGGRTMKTVNRDENWFFKPKELDFLLIL